MYICHDHQEQELQIALYAGKSLEQLRTSTRLTARDIRSIAVRTAGVKDRRFIPIVNTVISKLRATSHGLKSFAIWNVVIKVTHNAKVIKHRLGKAIKLVIQRYTNILQLHTVSRLNASNVVKQKAILIGQISQASIYGIYQTGSNYAEGVTFTMTDLIKHSDDISNNGELPDDWEELTPCAV